MRALTQDGAFRVIVALTTQTVAGTIDAQRVSGATAQKLGELVTGAVLVREAMAPSFRVQVILQGAAQGGSLVADSHPDGTNRGIVNLGGRRDVTIGPGSLLQVMRSLPRGLHQGVVQVPDTGGISGALMAYLQESEQVTSVLAVCATMQGDAVGRSCGYFVQLLPEADRGLVMVMAERLAALPAVETFLQGETVAITPLLDEILFGMPYTITSETSVRFGCHCSQERVLASLASLPESDISDLISANETLEIRCDGCGKDYRVSPADLLVMRASRGPLLGRDAKPGKA